MTENQIQSELLIAALAGIQRYIDTIRGAAALGAGAKATVCGETIQIKAAGKFFKCTVQRDG